MLKHEQDTGSLQFIQSSAPSAVVRVFKCLTALSLTTQSWFVAWQNILGKGIDLNAVCQALKRLPNYDQSKK